MQQQVFRFDISEKFIKGISSSIANEVANKIYYEFLLARYMPEILAIERGRITPFKNKAIKKYILQRIELLGK